MRKWPLKIKSKMMLWIPPGPSRNMVSIIPFIEAKGSYYIWRPSSLHTTVQYYLYYPIQTRYLVSQSFGVESSRPHNLLGWKKVSSFGLSLWRRSHHSTAGQFSLLCKKKLVPAVSRLSRDNIFNSSVLTQIHKNSFTLNISNFCVSV